VSGLLFPALTPELFFPFIFVDNSWSMISGRNVIGFPKVMAEFTPKSVLNANPFQITASALVLEKYAPTTRLDWKPFVKIKPDKGPSQPPDGVWPWIGLGEQLADPLLNELLQYVLTHIPNAFSTVQLKQFRDAPSTTDACYQAVMATRFTPSNIGPPNPLPPVSITVSKYASLDIPGSLGVSVDVPLHPSMQYTLTLDMSMSSAASLFVNS
jgi:Acetoacetate decarboxylase (ADC)